MTPHYHINLFWSEEDCAWIADVPDLRSCSVHGATPDEAIGEIQVAMKAWLDTARDRGLDIPAARHHAPNLSVKAA